MDPETQPPWEICNLSKVNKLLHGTTNQRVKTILSPTKCPTQELVEKFEKNSLYKHGIASDPQYLGVRNSYFPVRKGSLVKLYQDAHIKLIREPTRPLPRGGDLTLDELLKYKSQEGVRVLLLLWDDKTSHDKFFITTSPHFIDILDDFDKNGTQDTLNSSKGPNAACDLSPNPTVSMPSPSISPAPLIEGLMGTHDEETKKFFKHSNVICVLSLRYASSKLSIMKQQQLVNLKVQQSLAKYIAKPLAQI
uniref:Uncharacterized protein n=1 Tax=Solanum lycopersicum TaxID=4081 RepID=A0A3Q7G4P3_SOLLC